MILLAPNGKPSNLSPEQYKLVRTKAFKDWFGDWQNDPANASKILDENGEPLVVWHGTKADEKFNVFDKGVSNNGMFYFAKSKDYSYKYFSRGKDNQSFNLRPFFLNIRKNLDASQFFFDTHTKTEYKNFFKGIFEIGNNRIFKIKRKLRFWEIIRYADNLESSLIEKGYDGITFYENNFMTTKREDTDQWTLAYVVFNPEQIKLADGSNTKFDGNNPDIRYAGGGRVSNYREFYDNLQIEDGSKYIGQKFADVFPFIGKKTSPAQFRILVKDYIKLLGRLENDNYTTKGMKTADLNRLEKRHKYIDKKKYLSRFYLDPSGTIIGFDNSELYS